LEKHLFFQRWAVDESRIMGFEYYSAAIKYTPVARGTTLSQKVISKYLGTRNKPGVQIIIVT